MAFEHFLLGSHKFHGHNSWLVCDEVALRAMIGENRQTVTNKPVEFEK